ncbi:TonB-dependent receptor [Pedobacter metabolipauper]|uniref:Carboxypeptidase-like protein n=1 Tax=Pedobacter metabolipauper TaxID=425513 RepID=A0A4R6SSG4_9SPHI|nr:TonB-dependent receptor [Pedobacter metabolipauper]TDQ08237.1 carboxypeptidase-like protein [Pedobacter metabolipauper]
MKKFSLWYLSALIFLTTNVTAQVKNKAQSVVTQTIKGTVTDKNSKLAIAGVSISVTSMQPVKSTGTNENGSFLLPAVPVGRHSLTISYVGYQPMLITDLLLTSGKEVVLNLELDPVGSQLNEVVVNGASGKQPLNQMSLAGGRAFSPEETNRYAGAFFDPARMAQSFAGVVAAGDNNEIIVRGNSPKSLQWRLEGIEIVNPNHFGTEGAAGGAISMINTTVLGTSDFYTGALPAEYNNANSGVFDLKFRKGNTGKREYAFNIGVLGAGVTLEGPFKPGGNASYLVSYRYSSMGLLQKIGLEISDTGVPQYQDLSFNFVIPTKKSGTFSLFGIGGIGNLSSDAERDVSKWEERLDTYDVRSNYHAGSTGLKHTYIANNRLYFNNIISYSNSRSSSKTDSLTNSYQANLTSKTRYENAAFRYAGTLNYRVTDANSIRTGINASYLTYDLFALNYNKESDGLKELLNQTGNAHTFDAYIQDKHEFANKVTLNTGLHANYFNLSRTWSIEPRIGVKWQATPDQQFSFATGIYSRLEPLSYYFARDASATAPAQNTNGNLSPTKSAQAVFGYEKLFSGNLKFKSEVYYQHLYDVPVSADRAVNFSLLNETDNMAIGSSDYRSLVNKGTGKNYGLELSLEKSLSKGYYFMVTSSLFDAKFKALSGEEFNTAFNTRYVGNLLAGKEWTTGKRQKNLFGLNAKLIYAGGRRYSPILTAESIERDEWVIDQARVNTLKADPYVRLDYSMSYRINSKKTSHFILLDIQNVLNKINTTGFFYNSSKRIVEPNKWVGIIPTINYRIEM